MIEFLTQPLILLAIGIATIVSAFVHATRDARAITSVLLGGALCLGGILSWMGHEVNAFDQRCEAADGHARQFGTAMSSWVCLAPDGRVIEVKGPGL